MKNILFTYTLGSSTEEELKSFEDIATNEEITAELNAGILQRQGFWVELVPKEEETILEE